MKTKRIRALTSLLLAVFLLLPSLASCGMEELAASSESETTSPEESSTAVSREEESLEEASEDTGEEPMENLRDNPDYKNILLGKRYTRSALYPDDSSASYPDEGNVTLTDGQLPPSDGKYSDPAFAGFNTNNDYSDRGYASIRVDLNGLYCLDKFEVYVGSKAFLSVGISAPAFARVYASHDGETWYEVGITTHEDTEEVNRIPSVLELNDPITARYLEFRLVADVSRWMFVAEVTAYGIATDKELPYEETPAPELGATFLPVKSSYQFLFIGNSATYVNDIPATLASLCARKGITITQKQIVPGGRTLEEHAADPAVLAEIAKGYDAVFIQENGNSMTSSSAAEKSLTAIKKLGDAVHASGAVFCFYVRPPYGKDLAGYRNFDQCKLFDEHFTPAAEAQDAHCVYVNRAFAYAIKHLNYNLWGDDNAHTNTHGAYLAVCTFYATLFGKTATELGIAYGLPAADAKALQEAADQIALQGVIPWEE
ncbi:MAG: discoidin domain-containing protein [Clostridia bacterium]|nr:discoidin domain-containing protein [Clostridia bacterium]